MSESDFDRWIDGAYFYMLSDYVVAVTLSSQISHKMLLINGLQVGTSLKCLQAGVATVGFRKPQRQ